MSVSLPVSSKPNLQGVYVSDIKGSTEFYKKIFNVEPVFESSHYVAFPAGSDTIFSIWAREPKPEAGVPRYSEVRIMLPSAEHVDQFYENCQGDERVRVIEKPSTEVFGRTFVIADPDGHLIRVC